MTRNGYKSIGNLRVGEEIASLQDNKIVFKNVLKVLKNGKKDVYEFLRTDGMIYTCTPDHKFLTTEGMKDALEIQSLRLELYSIPLRDSSFNMSTYRETKRLRIVALSNNYSILNPENAKSFLAGLISTALRSNYVSKEDKVYFEFYKKEDAEYAYFAASLAGISCRIYRFQYIYVISVTQKELNKIIDIQAIYNSGQEILIREHKGKGYTFECELTKVGLKEVYDIEVKDTHNYIIEGCQVVHNCN
jgi:intein/homing endonuclease